MHSEFVPLGIVTLCPFFIMTLSVACGGVAFSQVAGLFHAPLVLLLMMLPVSNPRLATVSLFMVMIQWYRLRGARLSIMISSCPGVVVMVLIGE